MARANSFFTLPFDQFQQIISVGVPADQGVFLAGQPVAITTSNGADVQVLDWKGAVVYSGASASLQLPVGHYFVECVGDRSQFVVLPANYNGSRLIGTTANTGLPSLTQRNERVKPTWARFGWESNWTVLEPQAGQRNWAALDTRMGLNDGRKIILLATGKPAWVSNQDFLAEFVNYVKAMVQRYPGKIYAIEVWNEPSPDSFPAIINNDWVQTYVRLAKDVAAAVRAIDPAIKIYGPTWSDYRPFETLRMVDYGLADALDGFAWHYYDLGAQAPDSYNWDEGNHFGYSGPGKAPTLFRGVLFLRNLFPGKQIIVDELGLLGKSALGIPDTSNVSLYLSNLEWDRGMHRAVKASVMLAAGGVNCIVPHSIGLHSPDWIEIEQAYGWEGPIERGPHPKTSAFLMTGHWLDGAELLDYRAPGERVFLFGWKRPDNTSIVFAWSREEMPTPLKAGLVPPATDIFGRAVQPLFLTEEPVIFHANHPDAALLLAQALAALDMPLNNAPVIGELTAYNIAHGQLLQLAIPATDLDYDPLTVAASPLPAGAVMNLVTGVLSWTPDPAQVGPHVMNLSVDDGRGLSAAASLTINVLNSPLQALLNRWSFEEGNGATTADSVGTSHGSLLNFDYNPASGWTNGRVGKALLFDGVNDLVEIIGGNPAPTNNFSVSAWFLPQNTYGKGTIVALRTGFGTSGFRFLVDGGFITAQAETAAGFRATTFNRHVVLPNEWNHFVAVFDNSVVRGYLNGKLAGQADWGASILMNQARPIRLGAEYGNYFKGILDEIHVFNRPLSENEAFAMFHGNLGQPPVLAAIGPRAVAAGSPLTFAVSATDPDGDPLEFWAAPLPFGATFNPLTRVFAWTPTGAQAGVYNVTFTVWDGVYEDFETVAITVTGDDGNQPPVLDPIGPQSVVAGQPLNFVVSASDPDGDSLTYSANPLPIGATFNSATGVFNWTPTAGQTGLYQILFTVSDGSLSDSEAVAISVDAGNQPPVLDPIGPQSVVVSQTLNFVVSATDPNGDQLTYSANSLPSGATFNSATQTFNWTPTTSQAGDYQVLFVVSDGSLSDSETVDISVYAGNQPPVLDPIGPKEVFTGQLLTFTVTASDPNGDPLTFSTGWIPFGATFDSVTGVFSWTPLSHQVGGYDVTFTVSDGEFSDSEVVRITSRAATANQPPTLNPIGNQSADEGQNLAFTVSGSDLDNDPLTFSATGLPSGASFNTATRVFSWTPSFAQAGQYQVTFSVSDGSLTASETITITVNNVNRPPTLDPIGDKSVAPEQLLSFVISGSDPDGDPLIYSATNLPSGATFTPATRAFAWTPTAAQAGPHGVTFTVSDGGLSANETITITVTTVNQPPTLNPIGNKSVNEGQNLAFTVSGSDPDGNPITFSATNLPSGATFNTATRVFSWTPSFAQAGQYQVTFSVSDGSLTASETITITVNNVNRPPTLSAIGNKSVKATATLAFTINGSDPDGDAVTFAATGLPSGATFNPATRAFSWTPTTAQLGSYNVTFTVSDGVFTASETITITVTEANRPPVLNPIGNKTVSFKNTLAFTVTASDPDGDSLTFSAQNLPSGATFNTLTGAFSWKPKGNQLGNFTVTFSVSDGSLSASETIVITATR